jgi:RNA polymerase sigma-70 factor (ECF subfamily)
MGEPPHPDALLASAFADLLQTSQAALYAFVRHLTGSGEDARDIVQDVYVDAWRAAQRGSPPFGRQTETEADAGAIRRWLFHAAYCDAISLVRHQRLIIWQSLDEPDEATVLEPVGRSGAAVPFEDQIVEGEVLRAALTQLKPDDAACVLLDIVQGFSTAEIAEILGIAPSAARKRLSRAMERLRVAYFTQDAIPQAAPAYVRERADR